MVAQPFTPADRRRLIERTEELLSRKKLAAMIERHRNHRTANPHRLIELHLRMARAEERAGDPVADNDSLVAATEIAGVLDELDKWRNDPVWPEYQRALNESREYVHTATALCLGNALRIHHPATEMVPSKGPEATPDLRMVVTADCSLAIEVKAPTNVGSRPHAMTASEAHTAVERDGSDTNLMAIVIANLFVAVGDPAGAGSGEIGFGQKTRIRSNRLYAGPIEFVGDWSNKWKLVPRDRARRRPIYVVRRRSI